MATSDFMFSAVTVALSAWCFLAAAAFLGSLSARMVWGTRRDTSNWTLRVPLGHKVSRF